MFFSQKAKNLIPALPQTCYVNLSHFFLAHFPHLLTWEYFLPCQPRTVRFQWNTACKQQQAIHIQENGSILKCIFRAILYVNTAFASSLLLSIIGPIYLHIKTNFLGNLWLPIRWLLHPGFFWLHPNSIPRVSTKSHARGLLNVFIKTNCRKPFQGLPPALAILRSNSRTLVLLTLAYVCEAASIYRAFSRHYLIR